MKKNIFTIFTLISMIVGGTVVWCACDSGSSRNNPLGMQEPKWEKFVMVNTDMVLLFRGTDATGPHLRSAADCIDCDITQEELFWSNDQAPYGSYVDDYYACKYSVYPVIDESGDWYKVYIGTGNINEAYLQKKCSEEVKPEPITKEVVNKVKNNSWITHRLVENGKFANLYLERVTDFNEQETVSAGALTEGCIIVADSFCFFPVVSDSEVSEMAHDNEHYGDETWIFRCSKKYWKNEQEIFDANLLEDGDIQKIVTALRSSEKSYLHAWYYFPTVDSDNFVEFDL